jgi:hypothetical protein
MPATLPSKPIEQQRHEQLIKVLAEISSHLKQIAEALEAANLKTYP